MTTQVDELMKLAREAALSYATMCEAPPGFRASYAKQYAEDDAALRSAIEEALGQWIPVAERLPKESDRTVAVLLDNGEPAVAWATYWHGASNAFAEWTFPLMATRTAGL
jgi:hypothetical protein